MTNPTGFDQKLYVFISDSKVPTRSGLLSKNDLPPKSFRQVVVELADLSALGVNLSDIHVMHFFTERPPGDMEVYVDHIAFLSPGALLPRPSRPYVADGKPGAPADRRALWEGQGPRPPRPRLHLRLR